MVNKNSKKKRPTTNNLQIPTLSFPDEGLDALAPSPQETMLNERYPDVDKAFRWKWKESDDSLPFNTARKKSLAKTADALQAAAELCRYLTTPSEERTTPANLWAKECIILHAIHKAEDILDEIRSYYPTPERRNYALKKSDSQFAADTPNILRNDEEAILLWLPRIPPRLKSKRGPSLGFTEFQEMLRENQLTHFEKWHCSFIHAYSPTQIGGVLDADNYYFKPIIDALAFATNSCDSYDYFSFSVFNLPSNEFKKGLYIYISNPAIKIANLPDLLEQISPFCNT